MLPSLLSVIAGSADVTSLLAFGLFNSHITGNLVILADHIVAHGEAELALVLSVPLFVLVLCLVRLLVAALEAIQMDSLRPLLLLQFILLGGSFVLCANFGHSLKPGGTLMLLASQLGVAAMAVQGALVKLSLPQAPSTSVMTTNVLRFVMDAGEVLLGHVPAEIAAARHRASDTWPVIVGFLVGASLGAACFAKVGMKSMGLPAGLALIAYIMSWRAGATAGQQLG